MATIAYTSDFVLVSKVNGQEIELDFLQGLWTEAQYLRLSDHTNYLLEFTDGHLEILPMPTRKHQLISRFLFLALLRFVEQLGGIVLYAPLCLQLASGRFREPDLLLLLDKDDVRNQDAFWLGADLVVEIVSPDNPDRDLVEKRRDYAEAGIGEYWIVNPLDDTMTVLALDGTTYAEHGVFGRGATATSVLLEEFEVNVDAVFDAA